MEKMLQKGNGKKILLKAREVFTIKKFFVKETAEILTFLL